MEYGAHKHSALQQRGASYITKLLLALATSLTRYYTAYLLQWCNFYQHSLAAVLRSSQKDRFNVRRVLVKVLRTWKGRNILDVL